MGRTGTYIALDELLQISDNKNDTQSRLDIFETVRTLREQRGHMVSLFRFCV